jgi:glycosyltransferase involved in cell wall biosynthesis
MMQRLKILISHASIFGKSGWGRIFPLAVGLAKNGNKVTIITTSPHYSIFVKRKVIDNVNVIIFPELIAARISRLGFGFLSLILKILYVVFNKFDIVHSDNGHRPLSGIPCRVHKRIYGSIYVAEWYDWYGKGGEYDNKKKLFKILFGRYELRYEIKDKLYADGVVVLSDVLKQRAHSLFPGKKILKLHGGADVSAIPYISNNKSLKEKYGINKSKVTFGYINALNVNLEEIRPLIDSILELNLESKVKLLLFGSTNSLEDSLPKKVNNIIINFGWINYAEDYEKLQCVDVFVLFKEDTLGNRAGWPNCLGDYLACGRPVFLNPVGEVLEFVSKYPEGFFISTLSRESISNKLLFIVENQSVLIEKGKINRAIAENEISWYKKSELLNSFYNEIISE